MANTDQAKHQTHDSIPNHEYEANSATQTKTSAGTNAAIVQSTAPWALRILIGFSGLVLLVGFFLPWANLETAPNAQPNFVSGWTLATGPSLAGMSPTSLFVLPIVGAVLSSLAFMGFRYIAQTAVVVCAGLLTYALSLVISALVQHTAFGLWLTLISVLLTLLIAVIGWMSSRAKVSSSK